MSENTTAAAAAPRSFLKSLAYAAATLALSTWALGALWMHSS